MIKAIIFDLDGVLVNTEKVQRDALLNVLNKLNIHPSMDETRKYEGALTEELLKGILKKRKIIGVNVKKLAEERRRLALRLINSEGVEVHEGIMQLLPKIKNLNLKIAVATAASRPRAELVLEKTGINKYINVLITGSDVSKGKPDSEIFLLAAKLLGVDPNECIVIEDAEKGIIAARSAGMCCIAKDDGTKKNLSKADFVIKSFLGQDINRLIKRVDKRLS